MGERKIERLPRRRKRKLNLGYKGKTIVCVKIITLTVLMWQEVGKKTE